VSKRSSSWERPWPRWLAANAALAFLPCAAAQDLIFNDGFEPPPVPVCVSGPESGPTLGPTPPGAATTLLCFELVNDLATTRSGEAAWGAVPVARAANLLDSELDRLVVIGPGGRHLPAQFRALARWGSELADTAAPILWLGVSLRPDAPASSTSVHALQRYAQAPGVPDPNALTLSPDGAAFLVDTGLAEFRLDPLNPMLLDRARIRALAGGALTTVYQYQAGDAGHGLEVAVSAAGGTPLIAASNALAGSLAIDSFEWVEVGPIRAVGYLRGHLEAADDDRCDGDPGYYAFPYSVTITMTRGSRHLDYEWHFINACSDATGNNWTDQIVRVDTLKWNLRLNTGAAPNPATAGTGAVVLRGAGSADRFIVHQRRGAGAPWVRRAEVRNDSTGTPLESVASFDNPLVGLVGAQVTAALHAPWLRFREPQGFEVEVDRLAFRLMSEPSLVGEGKGLWFNGRLSLDPPGAPDALVLLEARRAEGRAALERGLVPRAILADYNASNVLAPLGSNAPSIILTAYQQYMDTLHDETIRNVPCTDPTTFQGGQWTCAKTYGSQLWPDIQFDQQFAFTQNATPNDNSPTHDYWSASNAELVEFARSGQPRWLWDFALPQVWLQAHTAYLNLGARDVTNRNAYAPTSGGPGDGQWHRSNFGSNDYSYNMGFALAYAARPTPALRERFQRMGATSINRFTNDPGDDTTWVTIGRVNVQYLRGLLYCAQFVPGAAGATCDAELREDLDYLAANSLSAGVPCSTMLTASANCFVGPMFMGAALFYPFLDEVLRLYGPTLPIATADAIRRTLIETPRVYRQYAIPNLPNGDPDPNADWWVGLECTLSGPGFTTLSTCTPANPPEPFLFRPNKPAATHLWFRSHALSPVNGLCTQGRTLIDGLFAGPDPLGPLRDYVRGGWAKASAQDAQSLAYAVGGYETCVP
jgi:hypothetical protein